MSLKIWDSLSKSLKEINTNEVKIYVCGPTVYDHLHIGHARMLFFFDILHRYLKFKYKKVIFVQNITDIDEKIIKKSIEMNCSPQKVADYYTKDFLEECKKLNLLDCNRPKVSDNLKNIIEYIRVLIEKNKAYISISGIYLDVNKVPYFQFEYKSNNHHRVELAKGKRSEKDFALWKFREDYGFDCAWGKGIPGWHIECSAMCLRFLGEEFHIHGGGIDLKFPHHENEIAQSYALCNKNPASIWMHNEMVNFSGEKMSKSLGNVKFIKDIVKDHLDADILRYYMLSTHYRSIIVVKDNFEDIKKNWLKIRKYYFRNIFNKEMNMNEVEELNNDLDTPKLFQKLNKSIEYKNSEEVKWIIDICGFHMKPISSLSIPEINDIVEQRLLSKKKQDYKKSDSLRSLLLENHIDISDGEKNEWFYL